MAAVCLRLLWPLMVLCVRVYCSQTPRSPGLDLLLPYTHGHGPSHSHRHTRDCQPRRYGNTTHSTFRADSTPSGPEADSMVFVTDVKGTTRWVYGHITVVRDPLRTLSVLEPGGPGGCGRYHVAPVELTSQSGGCIYAQNGGFFNTSNQGCLGNVVSDGRLVKDSGGVQNAQFGIRKDGSLVFGYLSQEELSQVLNPFVQLVSGVVWLLRDGHVYINQSLETECDKTQNTGALQYFVDVISARTAVGHDDQGRVIMVQIDGQTGVRGMNLWELADFLKKYGVLNAINLDGGGSSTFVKNGALASYPSDHCVPDGRWRCGRAVSTVLCVHSRRCEEECSKHGRCEEGVCVCEEGWTGGTCGTLRCEGSCGTHGLCTEKGCVCDAGYTGHNCRSECPPGLYGDGCNHTCSCLNGGSCDHVHGLCSCPSGFTGDSCQSVCPLGYFGLSCSERCSCEDSCPCDPQTGRCNATVSQETNYTLHTVGQCVGRQMFRVWRRDERSQMKQHYLSERSWLIISISALALLLCISLTIHILSFCRTSPHFRDIRDYSHVPLEDFNVLPRHTNGVSPDKTGQQADTDSEDELWAPHSNR